MPFSPIVRSDKSGAKDQSNQQYNDSNSKFNAKTVRTIEICQGSLHDLLRLYPGFHQYIECLSRTPSSARTFSISPMSIFDRFISI